MKMTAIKFFDKVILVLLGVAGFFSGCDINNGGNVVEYGVPSADYEIQGTVTDKATSQPIKQIRVVRPLQYAPEYGDTVYTNEEGEYHFEYNDFPHPTAQLKFDDIDGVENKGLFQSAEETVTFTNADQVKPGKGNWYDGKFIKTLNMALDKEPVNTPMYGVLPSTF
jgi:putative lipoprotein (rSAM/lipoprotein system)